MIYKSNGAGETAKIASDFAKKTKKTSGSFHSLVLAFEGELGAGKTTFIKSLAKSLGIKSHITSPTFVLMKRYKLLVGHYKAFYHIDAYRLKNFRDLIPLGIKEIIKNQTNIVAIEWADRVRPILPKNYIKIHIDHLNKTSRTITVND